MSNGTRIAISAAARCVTGLCRDTNEDAAHVVDLADGGVYLPPVTHAELVGPAFVVGVYDGCGHGTHGTPSRFVAAEIEASMRTAPLPAAREDLATRLREAVERGNKALFDVARINRDGMGTTATVAGICDGAVVLAHVGDSRAYVARDGTLIQITRDHTLIEEARAIRALSESEMDKLGPNERWLRDAKNEVPVNVLMRALGLTDIIEVDVSRADLKRGDRLLLCTDGLTGMIDDGHIRAILTQNMDPGDACDALVAAAEKAGGHDNISVVVVTYSGA